MARVAHMAATALLLSAAWGNVIAQTSNTVWRCWYEGRGGIACVVEEVRSGPAPTSNTALSPYAPEILRVLREDPGSMRGRIINIPIHTVPYDMANVARLAQLTVCGNRSDCLMVFAADRPTPEFLDRLGEPSLVQ